MCYLLLIYFTIELRFGEQTNSDPSVRETEHNIHKRPMLINLGGEQKKLDCFEHDFNLHVDGSCSLTWQNQLHIIGGYPRITARSISKLNGYKLELIGKLPFDFRRGGCSVMNNEYIYLCFDQDIHIGNQKRCWRSTGPLETFSEIALANHHHHWTKPSCSESKFSKLIAN